MRVRRGGAREPLPPGFWTIWTAVAVDLVGFGIVLPILPIYAKRYHVTSLQAALLIAVFSAAAFVFSPVWGRISDRIGRKPVLVISLLGTAAGSVLTGAASGLALLMIGRIVDGASGASIAVGQAAAADLARPGQRSRMFGLLGAAFGVGFVAGPAVGAAAALSGPRVPFFLAGGVASANAVVAIFRLPETRPEQPDRRAPRADRGAWAVAAPLVGVAFSAMVAFSAFEATFSLFGQRRLGFGIASAAGVFTAVGAVLVVVQAGVVHPVVSRLGEGPSLIGGLAGNAVGLGLLAGAHSWAVAAPALFLLTVGQGFVATTMTSTLAARADPSQRGQVLGLQQSASALARVAGPALGGILIGSRASGWPYVAGAILTAIAGLLILATRSRVIGVGNTR